MTDYAEQRGDLLKELDGLRYEIDTKARVGYLILDRPPVNVISETGRKQIAALLAEMDADPEVRVIVIRGANGAYCAGGDMRGFLKFPRDRMANLAFNLGMPERCRKPVIAGLEKFAMGAGFEMALACDVRIATENTQIALPEITLGIIPGSGGTQRLARIAGLGRAKDMLMRGRSISAAEAFDWGVVAEVVPDGVLSDDHAQARPQPDLRDADQYRFPPRGAGLRETPSRPRVQIRYRELFRQAQARLFGYVTRAL